MDDQIDNMDFDVMNYLNSSDDNLSSICEEFDFDLDIMLGYDGDNATDGFKHSDAIQSCFSSNNYSSMHLNDNKVSLNTSVPDLNKSYLNRAHKIVVPVCKITDDFKNEIKKATNALIVHVDKDIGCRTKFKRRLKAKNSKNCILANVLTSSRCTLKTLKMDKSSQIYNQNLNEGRINKLESYAHQKGSYLLPKINESDQSKWSSIEKSKNVKVTGEKVQIHHAHVDWKSYCLMKSMCEGRIENLIHRKGSILLPKIPKLPEDDDQISNNNMTEKLKIDTIYYKNNAASDENKNLNQTKSKISNNGFLKTDNCYKWKNDLVKEEILNEEKFSDKEEFKRTENNLWFMKSCKNENEISKYPQYKIRYLISMQKRIKRINCLPVPTHELNLDINNSVTEDEKLIMREFFRNTHLTLRYIEIRNHILECWKNSKPWYVSKTYVRYGLRNHGDVNVFGLVHRYLERIGAINFGCDLVHYADRKDSINGIPV